MTFFINCILNKMMEYVSRVQYLLQCSPSRNPCNGDYAHSVLNGPTLCGTGPAQAHPVWNGPTLCGACPSPLYVVGV